MKPFGAFLAILLVLLIAGCKAGGEAAVVGNWSGALKIPEAKKDDPMAKMAEGFASMLSMDLELKADHKFKITMMMIPIEGDWAMSGNQVTLTPKTFLGMTAEEYKKTQAKSGNTMSQTQDPSKPLVLELQSDGTMKMIDTEKKATAAPGDMIFTKKK